jgi:hypothetical protein
MCGRCSFASGDSTRHQAPRPLSERIYTGGNLTASFGTITYVYLAPLVGFRVTPKFSIGPSITYIYYKDNRVAANTGYSNYGGGNSSGIYGASVFARYLVLENLFAHTEYEVLNRDVYDELIHRRHRVNVTAFYVGGGYQQRIGMNSFLNFILLWNLNESVYSLYQNPIVRGGFNIGF